jgi:hypothetical protein
MANQKVYLNHLSCLDSSGIRQIPSPCEELELCYSFHPLKIFPVPKDHFRKSIKQYSVKRGPLESQWGYLTACKLIESLPESLSLSPSCFVHTSHFEHLFMQYGSNRSFTEIARQSSTYKEFLAHIQEAYANLSPLSRTTFIPANDLAWVQIQHQLNGRNASYYGEDCMATALDEAFFQIETGLETQGIVMGSCAFGTCTLRHCHSPEEYQFVERGFSFLFSKEKVEKSSAVSLHKRACHQDEVKALIKDIMNTDKPDLILTNSALLSNSVSHLCIQQEFGHSPGVSSGLLLSIAHNILINQNFKRFAKNPQSILCVSEDPNHHTFIFLMEVA